jgi:hypothetical protein
MLVAAGAILSCSRDSGRADAGLSATGSTENRKSSTDADVIHVVNDYVARLAAGDTASADQLRCSHERFGQHHSQLGAIVDSFSAELGGLAVADAEIVLEGDDGWTVGVLMEGATEQVNVGVVEEGGSLRVCGQSILGWHSVSSALNGVHVTSIPWTADTSVAMNCGSLSGGTQVQSDVPEHQSGDDDAGVVSRKSAKWSRPEDGTNLRVIITTFASADHAIVSQLRLEGEYLDNSIATLDASSVRNARAVRHLARSASFIQPPGVGPEWDTLTARYDDTLVLVSLGPLQAGVDNLHVVDVAGCIDELLPS